MKNKFGRAGQQQSGSLLLYEAGELARQTREKIKALSLQFRKDFHKEGWCFDLLVNLDHPGQMVGTNTVIFSMSRRGTATGKFIRADIDPNNNRLTLDRSGNRNSPDEAIEIFPFKDLVGMRQQTRRLQCILEDIIYQYKERVTPKSTPDNPRPST